MDILENTLFPFSTIRNEQRDMLKDVGDAVDEGHSLLAHAPTGIGKTAATIAPALSYGLENGKTVLFLTPKHSQHHIAIETLKKIKEKHGKRVISVDMIGKQWTCLYEGARDLSSKEFKNFCEAHRRNETCKFQNNIYAPGSNTMTEEAKAAIREIKRKNPLHSEEVLDICRNAGICPYEISSIIARSADVIICDYYHIFHPHIRQAMLSRMDKHLEDMILIIDEAHNLPERVRRLMSHSLSEYTLNNAIKEARALKEENLQEDFRSIIDALKHFGKGMKGDEIFLKKEKFTKEVEASTELQMASFIEDLEGFGETVLELPNRYRSYCLSVANFLSEWTDKKNEAAYARILNSYKSYTGRRLQLSIKCLDPALYSEEVFSAAHSSILMSGTLLPMDMYETILGIHNAKSKQYSNPFLSENRLVLLTNGINTKVSKRSERMWNRITTNISRIIHSVPGNIAVFFPSYSILNTIAGKLDIDEKEVLVERQDMSKSQRHNLYNRLGHLSENGGGALFAVQAGSFSEGMDFPGRMLDCAVVVGLPLERPTLETEALINYYDFKFGRGWDYGYIYPAMNRALQAAGRCIRSESDRGAIVLMDDRFKWQNYRKTFPKDMRFIATEKPEMYIKKFFKV
jgi:DNA excision repair protein ERCC-2